MKVVEDDETGEKSLKMTISEKELLKNALDLEQQKGE